MECLDNDPHQRSTAEQLVSRLEEMNVKVQSPQDHMAKLRLMGQLRQVEVRCMDRSRVQCFMWLSYVTTCRTLN